MLACCCAAGVAWSRESQSVCLGAVSQITNFIKRSRVQLLNRRSKERDMVSGSIVELINLLEVNL